MSVVGGSLRFLEFDAFITWLAAVVLPEIASPRRGPVGTVDQSITFDGRLMGLTEMSAFATASTPSFCS